jgi:hypothetical protein
VHTCDKPSSDGSETVHFYRDLSAVVPAQCILMLDLLQLALAQLASAQFIIRGLSEACSRELHNLKNFYAVIIEVAVAVA